MPVEVVGDAVHIDTADHPPRTDSPEYIATRKQLMTKMGGGCYICNGNVDMSHATVANSKGLQDHHGGGLYVTVPPSKTPVLVALTTFPMEWSEGFGADPEVVSGLVDGVGILMDQTGQQHYIDPITDQASVMAYVDSIFNANVKLCAPHHVGHPNTSSKDANGHEAVGIHNIPFPIFSYQGFNDWVHWDMFAGTTGTVAVAPDPQRAGCARVLHVTADHPDDNIFDKSNDNRNSLVVGPEHALSIAAHLTNKYRKMSRMP